MSAVKASLAWQYRFGDVHRLPAKQSVTQLTHRSDEHFVFDYSMALERKPKVIVSLEPDMGEPVEARLVGTATHLLIAKLNLAEPVTYKAVEETKKRLLIDKAITEAAAGQINTDAIVAFFEGELGRAALDTENRVYREWPFTFALLASELSASSDERRLSAVASVKAEATSDELVVVQGIIDMLVKKPGGLLVIDFKTDRVTAEEIGERAEIYKRQLDLYGRAAEAILEDKILGRWLYFLRPGCAVEV